MAMDNYSLADFAAVTDNGNGFMGGGNCLAWILLFALFGGNGWGGQRGGCVTEADLCNANSFTELKGSVAGIASDQAAIARQTDNAICQIGYQGLEHQAALSAQIADCCCTTQRAVDSVKFDMANYAAATNLSIVENTQKILDKMCAQENAALQARVSQLELERAVCGIPRVNPYGYGVYPTFGNCNVGCCNGAF